MGRFSRAFAGYSYQIIDLYALDAERAPESRLHHHAPTRDATADVLAGIFSPPTTGDHDRRRTSPSLGRRAALRERHHPVLGAEHRRQPVHCRAAEPGSPASFQFVGGPLGGSVSYYRPALEAVLYHPVRKKMALGLRGDFGYIRPFGDATTDSLLPPLLPRGREPRSAATTSAPSPPSTRTTSAIGGNKYLLFNAEYYFDVFGPVRLLAFFDAGEAYAEGQGFYWKTMSNSTGAELRFLMPVLNVPFRLIYAWNPNRDPFQPKTAFKFAVGTTF